MNTKRIGKWVMVFFLLAALPGLTAVMAQGQAPAGPEPSALWHIPWAKTESEPNNSRAAADEFHTVQGGTINGPGNVNYYKIYAPNWKTGDYGDSNSPILIDIKSAWGQLGSTLIKLYAPDGTLLSTVTSGGSNNNHDPLLYYNLQRDDFEAPVYYLSIESRAGGYGRGSQILVSDPLLISAAAANLGKAHIQGYGIDFQAGDVLAWSEFEVNGTTYEQWNMLLNLSDLGVKGQLTNLAGAWRNSDFLLLGFAANTTLRVWPRQSNPRTWFCSTPTSSAPTQRVRSSCCGAAATTS